MGFKQIKLKGNKKVSLKGNTWMKDNIRFGDKTITDKSPYGLTHMGKKCAIDCSECKNRKTCKKMRFGSNKK